MLGRDKEWTKITGKVIVAKHARFRGKGPYDQTGQGSYVVEYTVEGETKRVELKQVRGLNGYKMIDPGVGWKVPLLVDRRSGKVEFDVDDPKLAFPGSALRTDKERAERDAFKRASKDK